MNSVTQVCHSLLVVLTAVLAPTASPEPDKISRPAHRVGYFGDDPGDAVIAPADSIAVFTSLVFHSIGANPSKPSIESRKAVPSADNDDAAGSS